MGRSESQQVLSTLPSVDELLKSPEGTAWLTVFRRRIVLNAIRDIIASTRDALLSGRLQSFDRDALIRDIDSRIRRDSSFSLRRIINATGIVLHTNLGRSVLSERVLQNVVSVSIGFSNLEYDLEAGSRGKRHSHTTRLLREITGAEDALIVNNNAAAVLLCLNTVARGREVIVSRGELVEIGGSFRVPDIMATSSAILREVGTTNKTHLYDYTGAINDQTALLLKVHQSNYRVTGFTSDLPVNKLAKLGRERQLPVMYDLGSGCLLDLKPFGVHSEPSVKEVVEAGVDIITFSGDKLLGGPQGGIIVGRKKYLDPIRKNPLARAVRIDKMTIAAFEATLMDYLDEARAVREIPSLRMLFQPPEEIQKRAGRLASLLRKRIKGERFFVIRDVSKAGGGSLPEIEFPTFAVSLKPGNISVNELERKLRAGTPPVITRIKNEALLFDARTIGDGELSAISDAVSGVLQPA
ncbi:MAG: L-seryl-tRNA(Sec) selenium transferase [Nitrospiraceae bacterium]|nr:L-seryl-tRNA(Sec) selenium transferase [Nitrospiraceae bacterium]